ncbi:hypothetical protein ACEWY4_010712 [Coilia grayii]|uniref:DNA/RNA-binding protein Alba-like domain-containing protein n=1 Tax=Coilia grayii TaxID=363190 RepID=A0ABD1K2N7_9TELE
MFLSSPKCCAFCRAPLRELSGSALVSWRQAGYLGPRQELNGNATSSCGLQWPGVTITRSSDQLNDQKLQLQELAVCGGRASSGRLEEKTVSSRDSVSQRFLAVTPLPPAQTPPPSARTPLPPVWATLPPAQTPLATTQTSLPPARTPLPTTQTSLPPARTPLPPVWATLPPSSSLRPAQSGFRKVSRAGEGGPWPIPGLADGVLEMRVREGSKIRNLLGFALVRMQDAVPPLAGRPTLSQILFTGSGRAITKTITCAEILKRQVGGLHQLSKLQYRTVREEWEGRAAGGACSRMTIHRMEPAICILLSKEPLDPCEPGYQPPEEGQSLANHSSPEYQPQEEVQSLTNHITPRYQPPKEGQSLTNHSKPAYQPQEELQSLTNHSRPQNQPAKDLYNPSNSHKLRYQPSKELNSLSNHSTLRNQPQGALCCLFDTHSRGCHVPKDLHLVSRHSQPEEHLYASSNHSMQELRSPSIHSMQELRSPFSHNMLELQNISNHSMQELQNISNHSMQGCKPPVELQALSNHSTPAYHPKEDLGSLTNHSMQAFHRPKDAYVVSSSRMPAELLCHHSGEERSHSLSRAPVQQTPGGVCPFSYPIQTGEELYCPLADIRGSAQHCATLRKRTLGSYSPSSQPKAKAALFDYGNI